MGDGLRAGKPSVIVPFFRGQPFWGRYLHRLDATPRPAPGKKLTADKLAAAIRKAVSNREMQQKAEAVDENIRKENGNEAAVSIIESLPDLTGPPSP